MSTTTIIGSIERGHYVARLPSHNLTVAVPLAPIGRRVGGVEIGAVCERLGTVEIGGKRWKKFTRKVKKGVKKTVAVAKKVANNQIVKSLYNAAKSVAPPPFGQILGAVETGVKFGKALASGSSVAKAALPVVQKLAAGKITLQAAKKLAPSLGVKPETIRDAAATIALKKAAVKNPKLASVFKGVAKIEATVAPAKPVAPGNRIITTRSGKRYSVAIRPAA